MKLHKVSAVAVLRKSGGFKGSKGSPIYAQYLENTGSDERRARKMHNLLLQFAQSPSISELARRSEFVKPVSVTLSGRLGFSIMLWALGRASW